MGTDDGRVGAARKKTPEELAQEVNLNLLLLNNSLF